TRSKRDWSSDVCSSDLVWFAESLISATADEVRRLIAKAKEWALALGKPVALWLSDRQDAFVTGIAAEFPDVPHRYCANHFLRDQIGRASCRDRVSARAV